MSAERKTVRQFFVSRIVRLYPAFWISCTLTAVIVKLLGAPKHISVLQVHLADYLINMTMLVDFLGKGGRIDAAYWSLAYEIVFYFLISIIIGFRLLNRLSLLLMIWLAYVAFVGPSPEIQTLFTKLLIPDYAPYFISGMVFYMFQYKKDAEWKLWTLLTISFVLCLRSMVFYKEELEKSFHDENAFSLSVLIAFLCLIFIVFFIIINRKFVLPERKLISIAGAITYPLYLIHGHIGYVIYQHIGDLVDKYVLLLIIVIAFIFVSYMIHILIEKPLSKPFLQFINRCIDKWIVA